MAVAIGSVAFSHPELDQRQQQPSASLALATEARTKALAPANFQLEAATTVDFRNELTACLALCAPSGMSEENRTEWLKVAWGTLQDIPADLLARGCAAARRQADHPAKIIPTIIREVGAIWDRRKVRRADASTEWDERESRQRRKPINVATPEEIAAIKAEIGLVTQPYKEAEPVRGPARMPTRADYIAMGVDAAALDGP